MERFFYDDYKVMLKDVEEQALREEGLLTEEEKLVKEKERQQAIQALFEKSKNLKSTVNVQKVEIFNNLKLETIALADELGANMLIEWKDDNQAVIRFASNMFIINKDSATIYKKVLCKLVMTSDHIWIDTKHVDNEVLVQMEFWFDLCDEEEEIEN